MNNSMRFYFSTFLIGIISGLAGVCLTFLMHHVQHWAFDYGENGVEMSFREGVEQSSWDTRMLALTLCGILVGFGWYGINKYGAKLISIKKSLENPQQGVPFFTTISHSLLQIITVGLGSPLGREVAPREMSVALATQWVKRNAFSDDDARLLLACASGAGLTAVYNVPLAATVFILETMLLSWNKRALGAAFLCVVTATLTARLFLGDLVQYSGLPELPVGVWELVFSSLLGGFIGIGANLFQATTKKLPLISRSNKRIVLTAILAFVAIGLLSLYRPEILGNGKAGNQLTFHAMISGTESLELMALKWLAVLLALAAGAYGGLITPSMMMGSTFAYALAWVWNFYFPTLSLEIVAIVGAAAFLGISLKMPLTAVIFLLELTRSQAAMLMPLTLAMAAAVLSDKIYQRFAK